MTRKDTVEDFIAKARVVHGDRYDYARVVYVNNTTRILVGCKTHGFFSVIPSSHSSGKHCIKCQGKFPLDRATFVLKASELHKNEYSYENVGEIFGNKTKVSVTCKLHGGFPISPNNHLSGRGKCPTCQGRRKDTAVFVAQATAVFGDRYDYSKTEYVRAMSKVTVTCRKHGDFLTGPNNHLHGYGCQICGGSLKHTHSKFVERARAIHGDKYDYTQVNYTNCATNVTILCKTHGAFLQTPNSHLVGKGCHSFARSGFNPSEPAWLYIVRLHNGLDEYVGYGITNDIKTRFKHHRRSLKSCNMILTPILEVMFDLGRDARSVESLIRRCTPTAMLGVDGFRREATYPEYLPMMLAALK